jgi:hypothetical protein
MTQHKGYFLSFYLSFSLLELKAWSCAMREEVYTNAVGEMENMPGKEVGSQVEGLTCFDL